MKPITLAVAPIADAGSGAEMFTVTAMPKTRHGTGETLRFANATELFRFLDQLKPDGLIAATRRGNILRRRLFFIESTQDQWERLKAWAEGN